MDYSDIETQLITTHKFGIEDDDSLYIELDDMIGNDRIVILGLIMINVPPKQRRLGIATRIIQLCEKIAQNEQYSGIYVGPFMTDESEYLIKSCRKMRYVRCLPFGMSKSFNCGSITTVIFKNFNV